MKSLRYLLAAVVAAFVCAPIFPQDLDSPLPTDPNVTIGKLDNGIVYYVRYNKRPEKRAELRLAVNAGSVLESDNQLGLAHFVEHMGFRGTRHFKGEELVNFMESIGMRYGPEVNAYTGFDETVYMLTIPTDSAQIIEKAFDILEDWSHYVTFGDAEIDKERGVVIEEWRQRRSAEVRMLDKQLPIILKDSRYAERLPIGKKETLESFKHDTLRQFYKTWYRPDLMAVVAVGDFDKSQIEGIIRKHFSTIPIPPTRIARPLYPVPDNQEPLFAIAADPEATSSRVTLYYKQDVTPEKTIHDYRTRLVEQLYNGMLNNRLNELTKQSDPPFLGAYSQKGDLVRSKDAYYLEAVVQNNGIERGLDALLTEAARVRTYGLTRTEFDREKKSMLREVERAFNERDKTESRGFAGELVANFLTKEPIPGIETEFELEKRLLPTIDLLEVNKLAGEWIRDHNCVVAVNCPQKPDVHVPTQEELTSVFASIAKKEITPYIDKATTLPLVATPPKPAEIAELHEITELGVTEWVLSNGVRVILKPTDFKNDQVLFSAFGPGGTSLVQDKDYFAASTAASVVQEGGVGSFDLITLQKMLTGKIVQVSPYISELNEGLSGSASPADLETMFQLIYLYCTSPRMDSTAFQSLKTRIKGFVQNRNSRPESALDDTVQVTMAQHNYRRRPISDAILDEMNLQTSFNVYRDRFADASDFTFVFVGSFKPAQLETLVKTYLGGLPSRHRNEMWKDLGIEPPTGVIEKTVKKGIEPKSSVRMLFTGPFPWSPEDRYAMSSLNDVLRIKLREAIREEKGGTYSVRISSLPSHYPRPEYRITVSFVCAPERVEELTKAALQQIDSVKQFGATPEYISKVKEIQLRERETNLRENRFWLNALQAYYDNKEDPRLLLEYDRLVAGLSNETIQKAAKRFFDMRNYARFVLYPQEK